MVTTMLMQSQRWQTIRQISIGTETTPGDIKIIYKQLLLH